MSQSNQGLKKKKDCRTYFKKTELVCHGDSEQRNKSVNYKSTFPAVPGSSQSLRLIPSALTPSNVFDFFPDRK